MSRRFGILALVLLGVSAAYMLIGIKGSWEFALTYRGEKLIGLLIVATAISTSTLLFHTISGNRILTPSLIGFDALFVMILSLSVFTFGANSYLQMPDILLFIINAGAMCVAALVLFSTMLRQNSDLMRLILTGIIAGTLFRALSSLVQRLIDPNEYSIIAANSFASFSSINRNLLVFAGVVCVLAVFGCWKMRHHLDITALGRQAATNLGVDHRRVTLSALLLIAVLVSVSTALVGPVAFLGLLVVSVTYVLVPTSRHAVLIPASALVSAITLIGGQMLMERVFAFATPLSVVIDIAGGGVFLWLIFKRVRA